MELTINDKKYTFEGNKTILDACKEAGIDIPNLCHDPRCEPFTSCYVCVVEVEGARGFVPACGTSIRDGMVVKTHTDAIRKTRKMAFELLLSDHAGDCLPPCRYNCPAGIDIQSYLACVANKDYDRAIRIIKDRNPLPLVCGRICPRPCEDDCRRRLIDEAVAVDNVKRFVADLDLNKEKPYLPEVKAENGKTVAIVGAGPAGLTCAYYLRIEGYRVKIFEATDKPGGMLMWGIPEYRLPKAKLMKEVSLLTTMGIEIEYNKKLGRDFSLDELRSKYDAVFLGIGAQKSTGMRVENEDVEGVYGGIHFLAAVARGEDPYVGKKVIVVGGGNTAMDAARTAIRKGAQVDVVYRRTREEMPAEEIEIIECEHEGAQYKFLRAPIEVVMEGDRIKGLRCQIMELGEPDESGRRKPVPVEGKEELIEADVIIAAIGQYVDASCLENQNEELGMTRWNTINAVEEDRSYRTNLKGVFAGGDAVTGPGIAIGAISHGMYAARSIDSYLTGRSVIKDIRDDFAFSLGRQLKKVNADYIKQVPTSTRHNNQSIPVKARLDNFNEVEMTISEAEAIAESQRCLSCGCLDYEECKLRIYANEYGVVPDLIKGDIRKRKVDESSEYLVFDSTKCIKCGKCIRVCSELKGIGALGFVHRGFQTDVLPTCENSLIESDCVECGQCEAACPAGAIQDKYNNVLTKSCQLPLGFTDTLCKECSLGCKISVGYLEGKAVRIVPGDRGTVNEAMLCKAGKYESLPLFSESQSFDTGTYQKMSLYDPAIGDLGKTISSADTFINYNVDIFKHYAPVSYELKKAMDTRIKSGQNPGEVIFVGDGNTKLYGFTAYPIEQMTRQSIPEDLKTKIDAGKNVVIVLEETKLTKDEISYFTSLKGKDNIKIINTVLRKEI